MNDNVRIRLRNGSASDNVPSHPSLVMAHKSDNVQIKFYLYNGLTSDTVRVSRAAQRALSAL